MTVIEKRTTKDVIKVKMSQSPPNEVRIYFIKGLPCLPHVMYYYYISGGMYKYSIWGQPLTSTQTVTFLP